MPALQQVVAHYIVLSNGHQLGQEHSSAFMRFFPRMAQSTLPSLKGRITDNPIENMKVSTSVKPTNQCLFQLSFSQVTSLSFYFYLRAFTPAALLLPYSFTCHRPLFPQGYLDHRKVCVGITQSRNLPQVVETNKLGKRQGTSAH